LDRRVYYHAACGGYTEITGYDFERLVDPFDDYVRETHCAGCRNYVPIKFVRWADTGEDIETYRQRLRNRATVLRLIWRNVIPIIVGAVAFIGAILLDLDEEDALIIAGIIAAASWFFTRWLWSVDYRREK
jgi:hypothetical protein